MLCYPQCWAALRVIFDGLGGDDSKELILDDIQPLDATVHFNGYNQADTFELGFLATRLPFSPEIIKTAGVDIYMFNLDRLVSKKEARDYLVEENRVMHGIIDDGSLSYSRDGRSIHFTGRDYTAILIDRKWPPGQTIPTGRDLAETVQDMVDEGTNFIGSGPLQAGRSRSERLTVKYAEDLPAVLVTKIGEGITKKSTNNAGALKAIRKAERKKKPPKKPKTDTGRSKTTVLRMPVPSGRSYWDAITELCLDYGRLVYINGTDIIIRAPQSMSDETADRILRFAYGRNLAELTIERHFGRESAPQIVASFYDEKARAFKEVKWPTDDKKLVLASGSQTINFRRITLPPGVKDEGVARDFCKSAYHTYGRSEAGVKFSTKALRDLQNAQVMKLRPGDPVSVGWDSLDKQDLREKSVDERVKILLDLGYRQQVSNVIAQNYERLDQLRRPLYTKANSLSYTTKDGISVSAEAINYIVPSRDDDGGYIDAGIRHGKHAGSKK